MPRADQEGIERYVYVLSDSGHLRLPHLESEILAKGLTPMELCRRIESAYTSQNIYKAPLFAVHRATSCDDTAYVHVYGQVPTPGLVVLQPGLSVLKTIAERGGCNNTADPTRVRLFRDGKIIEMDVSLVEGIASTLKLEDGDFIVVPKLPKEPNPR